MIHFQLSPVRPAAIPLPRESSDRNGYYIVVGEKFDPDVYGSRITLFIFIILFVLYIYLSEFSPLGS